MFEDSKTNRLMDALRLYEEIANNPHFENTPVILFLNKRDLFLAKLADGVPLQQPNPDTEAVARGEQPAVLFSDYTGGSDPDSAIRYLVGQFVGRAKNKNKEVFWRVTCATDTQNVETVFTAARDIILRANLASGFE
jgi:hypothetical protein